MGPDRAAASAVSAESKTKNERMVVKACLTAMVLEARIVQKQETRTAWQLDFSGRLPLKRECDPVNKGSCA